MYKYPLLFDLFCGGLESGKIRGIPKMGMSPIEDIINVAHEAHIRLELWYAMVNHAYRHEPSKFQRTSRHEKHTTLCALVLWHWNAVNVRLMHLNTEVPYSVARKHNVTAAATTIRVCPKNFIKRTFTTSSSYDLRHIHYVNHINQLSMYTSTHTFSMHLVYVMQYGMVTMHILHVH
jgi:hypothetical protein